MERLLSSRPEMSSSEYVYEMVTGASKESSSVMLSMSALTSKTTLEPLSSELEGFPMEPSTVSDERPLIWITMDEEVAVKFSGVSTVIVLLPSVTVEVAAEDTVTTVEVAVDGIAPPEQPVVRNVLAVEVAALPAASRDTTR